MALSENPTLEEIIDEAERLNNLVIDRGGTRTITPSTTNQVLSKGNYKGDITILGDSDLIASNIKSGVNIFGINGSVKPYKEAMGTVRTSDSGWTPYVQVNGLDFTPIMVFLFDEYGLFSISIGDAGASSSAYRNYIHMSQRYDGYGLDGTNRYMKQGSFSLICPTKSSGTSTIFYFAIGY